MIDRILALDQATTLGHCVGTVGARPTWGALRFRGEGNGEIHAAFRTWLVRTIETEKPTIAVFESPYIPRPKSHFVRAGTAGVVGTGPPPMNPLVLRRLLYMAGCIEEVCHAFGVRCREVTPAEVSKFLLGRVRLRRVDKKAQTMQMIRAYGFDVATDDAADAVAIWLMAEATIAPALAAQRGEGPLFLPRAS